MSLISTEEQPSAQTVQRLVESVKAEGVSAIFAETTINPALIKTVAQEAGVKLAPKQLYSDSIGTPGSDGDTYIKMMVANTRSIVEALGGKYTPFEAANRQGRSIWVKISGVPLTITHQMFRPYRLIYCSDAKVFEKIDRRSEKLCVFNVWCIRLSWSSCQHHKPLM